MKPRKISSRIFFAPLLACLLAATSLWAVDPPVPANSTADSGAQLPYKNIGVAGFAKLRAGGTNIVLDVRSVGEYQAGHIPGAVNLDVNAPDFKQKLKALDPNKLYLVHCASGVRSAKACKIMSTLRFANLVNLEGGFRAWQKAGEPVEH